MKIPLVSPEAHDRLVDVFFTRLRGISDNDVQWLMHDVLRIIEDEITRTKEALVEDDVEETQTLIKCVGFHRKAICTYCQRRDVRVYRFEWSWTGKFYAPEGIITSGEEWEEVCEACLIDFFDNEADPLP
jgi:hypothetical protein